MKKIKLTDGEPILEVLIQPTTAFAEQLKLANQPVPKPVSVLALIDTGFTGGLMVSETLVKRLGLKTRGWSELSYPQDVNLRFYTTYVWDVDMGIKFINCSKSGANVLIETLGSMVEFVNNKNSEVLVGQKILQSAEFFYNGKNGYFGIQFPK